MGSTRFLRLLGVGVGVVSGWGCAERIPLPITASQLGERWTGPALVAYLGQPDASAAVCDLRAPHPGVAASNAASSAATSAATTTASISEDMREKLVDGLHEGTIAPTLWRVCVDRMVSTADPESAARLLDQIMQSYGRALFDLKLQVDPILQARVEAMEAVYLDRPSDRQVHVAVVADLASDVGAAMTRHRLGPWATLHGAALLEAMEIDQGRLHGRTVDVATLDQLLAAGDETLLRRCSQRLPAPELRTEARRRVIRLRIRTSSDPDLRAHAAAVEDTVMRQGVNRVLTSAYPPLHARMKLPVRRVLVRQQLLNRTGTLLGSAEHRLGVSVLPELSLRDGLEVDLAGLARPVTVCASAAALDPEPCLGADEITIDSPLVTLDRDGALHFVDHLSGSEVARLAREADRVALPVSVAGRRLLTLEWALAFEKPDDLVLRGTVTGPNLLVRVEHGQGARLVDTVRADNQTYVAIVESADAPRFRIVSRGPDGAAGNNGLPGSDGSMGSPGSSASCPSMSGQSGGAGGSGSAGSDGGHGGNGGNGGAIQIDIVCGVGATCDDNLVVLIRKTIVSVGGSGGPGGSGGSGGRGGPGGSGGAGTSCTTDDGSVGLAGGSDGPQGSDGSSGRSGFPGSDGAPGPVSVRFTH